MLADTPFDELEIRSVDGREQAFFSALPNFLSDVIASSHYYRDLFADVDPTTVTNRQSLAKLPITRKSSLHDIQKSANACIFQTCDVFTK